MSLLPSKDGTLIWVDLETDGFEPAQGQILEIGIKVTDSRLRIQRVFQRVIALNPDDVDGLHDWSIENHGKSGLLQECMETGMPLIQAEEEAIAFIQEVYDLYPDRDPDRDPDTGRAYRSPMCGSSVHFDRTWLKHYCPGLEAMFTHRNVDVSTLYELSKRSHRDFSSVDENLPVTPHRALGDLTKSIELLRRYRVLLDF